MGNLMQDDGKPESHQFNDKKYDCFTIHNAGHYIMVVKKRHSIEAPHHQARALRLKAGMVVTSASVQLYITPRIQPSTSAIIRASVRPGANSRRLRD
jgi:hypothetical protein